MKEILTIVMLSLFTNRQFYDEQILSDSCSKAMLIIIIWLYLQKKKNFIVILTANDTVGKACNVLDVPYFLFAINILMHIFVAHLIWNYCKTHYYCAKHKQRQLINITEKNKIFKFFFLIVKLFLLCDRFFCLRNC